MDWSDDDVRVALATQHADLAALLRDRTDADWKRASACPGWDVSDVLLHLAQTDEIAIASLEDRFNVVGGTFITDPAAEAGTVDDAAGAFVAQQRGESGAAIAARWEQGATQLRARLAKSDPRQRVQWVAGEMTARTLATTRLSECWIHTGDIAPAFGVEEVVDDRLRHIARLAWRTLPYAFARAGRELTGPVGFDLAAPAGGRWAFGMDDDPPTVVRGPALDLCMVAAQRKSADATGLVAVGPDAGAVLELVRTFA